jgi:hypothetical protein
MTAVGLDPADFELETFADEWYASVTASEQLDGQFAGRTFNTGFGAEGVLQYAGGMLAEPAPAGPYPLVDLDTAIARLNDPTGFYMGGFGGGIALDTAVASREAEIAASEAGVDIAEADVAAAPPATEASGGGNTGNAGSVDVAPPVSEPVPVEIPAPQEVTVTLVDVQPDVWWVWDVDGSVWLLPGYRFIGDDGGWYTVPAVTDEFLVRVPVDSIPPTPEPAPLPPDTAPTEIPPATSAPEGTPSELVALIGLPLDAFTASAESLGYTVRVVYNDEIGSLAVTDDFSETRVNVHTRSQDGVETVYLIASLG